MADNTDVDGGLLVDDQIASREEVAVGDAEGHVASNQVDQPPVQRSRRIRKPNSKYDPEVFDLDSVKIREIPLSGRRNGWRGIYWPT